MATTNEGSPEVAEIQQRMSALILDFTSKMESLNGVRNTLKAKVETHFEELMGAITTRKNTLSLLIDQQVDSLYNKMKEMKEQATSAVEFTKQMNSFASQIASSRSNTFGQTNPFSSQVTALDSGFSAVIAQKPPIFSQHQFWRLQLRKKPHEVLKQIPVINAAVLPLIDVVFQGSLVKDIISKEGEIITGEMSTIAGGQSGGYKDGRGAEALFNSPHGIVLSPKDRCCYVADYSNNRIRKIAAQGEVSTFAGSGEAGWADGLANSAKFNGPFGITLNHTTGDIYVSEISNNRIRKITSGGQIVALILKGLIRVSLLQKFRITYGLYNEGISTLAGSGNAGSVDGRGSAASFNNPRGIDVDQRDGSIYVVDCSSHKIRKISPQGDVTTIAGSTSGFSDGRTDTAQFSSPNGVCVDPTTGDIYVADNGNHRIRKISGGMVATVTGTGVAGSQDGGVGVATFSNPFDVKFNSSDGSLLVADCNSKKIRKFLQGQVSTLTYPDGDKVSSLFNNPISLSIDPVSHLCYVSDYHAIKRLYLH